ncbi:hypothetical protein CFL1_01635 [Lactobacillus delbrueckii subsp. bulgaricus]|nr:hypothetical protein CFL1_01635 [Lactobacillus delbrueckii subsp. bulgaricus]
MMNRILPSNEALVNFASLCLAITLNILSYTTLMFIACKIELPLAEDKRQNRIVLGLPIAISIFDIVCALFAPNLIFSANDINAFTPFPPSSCFCQLATPPLSSGLRPTMP